MLSTLSPPMAHHDPFAPSQSKGSLRPFALSSSKGSPNPRPLALSPSKGSPTPDPFALSLSKGRLSLSKACFNRPLSL